MVTSLVGVATPWGWKVGLVPMLREQAIIGFEVRKEFFSPQGRLELVPRVFLPFSAALSRALFQGSSGSFWLSACLLLLHPKDPTGALGPSVELLLS